MKKNYLIILSILQLLLAISCDSDKLEEELDAADKIIVPDYDGIFAFSIGNIEYTVDSLLEDAGDDLEHYTNPDGIIVFRFNEGDTVDIDEELGEQPDLDFDVELIQTLEVPSISFAIDFFEEFDGGSFDVESPKLSFNFTNTLQIPSSIWFKNFQAVKYDENGALKESEVLDWNNDADSLQTINAPTRIDTAKKETTNIYMDVTNSNLRDLLSIQPDSLTMEIGFVAFPDVPDTVIYFDIDTLGPYIVNVDTVIVTPIDSDGDGFPDLDNNGDPIVSIDTVLFNLGSESVIKNPQGSPPYGTDELGNITGFNQRGTKMTLIPDSTEIIPIYVASANDILEAATGEDQNGDGVITSYDNLEVVFNTNTGRIEEGMDEYITNNLIYSHPEPTYDLLDTLFVGTDLSGVPDKAILDPTTGAIAWAIVVTRYTALYGLNSGAVIESDVVMELPIELSLDSLTVIQEIDFDSGNDITDILDELDDNDQNVPSVTLNFTSVNELPLGISINMDFLDASSKSLYSQKNVQLIDAPTLTDGTLAGSTSSNSIVLDSKGIEALKTTETIQLILKLNTPENVFLPLLETAKVNVTLSMKVTN